MKQLLSWLVGQIALQQQLQFTQKGEWTIAIYNGACLWWKRARTTVLATRNGEMYALSLFLNTFVSRSYSDVNQRCIHWSSVWYMLKEMGKAISVLNAF